MPPSPAGAGDHRERADRGPQRTLDMLRRLKALGVAIAMDDFGTGYSSLSYLQAFPFDKIKIDKSFVDKIGSRQQAAAIVTAVLGLGRSLDIPVLAEGVENEEQRSFLDNEACAQAQGYLFGRPAPLADIRHLVYAAEKVKVTETCSPGRGGRNPLAGQGGLTLSPSLAASHASDGGTRCPGAWHSGGSRSWPLRQRPRASSPREGLPKSLTPIAFMAGSLSSSLSASRAWTSSSAPSPTMRSKRSSMRRCNVARSTSTTKAAASSTETGGGAGGAALPLVERQTGHLENFKRPQHALRIARAEAAVGLLIAFREQRMEGGDTVALQALGPALANIERNIRNCGKAFRQRLEIRGRCRRRRSAMHLRLGLRAIPARPPRARLRRNSAPSAAHGRRADRRAVLVGFARTRGENAEAVIALHRVGIDDPRGAAVARRRLGERQRSGRLAARGRPGYQHDPRRSDCVQRKFHAASPIAHRRRCEGVRRKRPRCHAARARCHVCRVGGAGHGSRRARLDNIFLRGRRSFLRATRQADGRSAIDVNVLPAESGARDCLSPTWTPP